MLATQPKAKPIPASDFSNKYMRGTPTTGPRRKESAKTFPPISSLDFLPESLLISAIGPPIVINVITYAAPSKAAIAIHAPIPEDALAKAESGSISSAEMSIFASIGKSFSLGLVPTIALT